MKRVLVCLIIVLSIPMVSMADEGMWLINAFENNIYPQMKKQGLKLTPGEIYNESSPALSSAIVAVDGGMGTGSMISDQGLMITNHHVAYSDLCALSTLEQNYLENGFWALERNKELPVAGKTVMFLRKVINVTDRAHEIRDSLATSGSSGSFTIRKIYRIIENQNKAENLNSGYEISCASMWKGELFLLFCYEVYSDVRLVGAPPVRIGAFGGEQDNWQWPQHKGDFALYRVYADKNGQPAKYSKDNTPLKPLKVLNVSTSGVHDGDYTMVLGFPGRTARYMSSFAVEQKRTITNPIIIQLRRDRLDIMKKHMAADPNVRIKYSDRYFGLSNYADYAKWENICLRRYDVTGVKATEEVELQKWIDQSPERVAKYGTLLADMKKGYAAMADVIKKKTYFQEAWLRPSEVSLTGNRLSIAAAGAVKRGKTTLQPKSTEVEILLSNSKSIKTSLDLLTDKEIYIKMVQSYTDNIPRDVWGEYLVKMYDKFDGNVGAMANYIYDNTVCTSFEKLTEYFSKERTPEEIMSDPMAAMAAAIDRVTYEVQQNAIEQEFGFVVDELENTYALAVYEMLKDKGIAQSPDANSSMRITYGTVGPINPYDGVSYASRSTIKGYREKYNPEDYEFRVDDKIFSLIDKKDWGRWGEKGEMYVNFVTNNDITGGNSGSPVLNGKGDVVGLAFDGNRESMSGDIYFHSEYSKTVCVDIRFVMWLIEKYAGASSLIEEMNLVK